MRHGRLLLDRWNRPARVAGCAIHGPGTGTSPGHPRSTRTTPWSTWARSADPGTFVNAINSRGAVVGGALTSVPDPICTGPWHQAAGCYYEHAFKWRKGVLTDLGTLPGGSNSFAAANNSQGAVFGISENGLLDPVYGVRAFVATIWNDGEVQDLGTLGGGFSWPGTLHQRPRTGCWRGHEYRPRSRRLRTGSSSSDPKPSSRESTGMPLCGRTEPFRIWGRWATGSIPSPSSSTSAARSPGSRIRTRSPTLNSGFPTVDPFFWENGQMIDIGHPRGHYSSPRDRRRGWTQQQGAGRRHLQPRGGSSRRMRSSGRGDRSSTWDARRGPSRSQAGSMTRERSLGVHHCRECRPCAPFAGRTADDQSRQPGRRRLQSGLWQQFEGSDRRQFDPV